MYKNNWNEGKPLQYAVDTPATLPYNPEVNSTSDESNTPSEDTKAGDTPMTLPYNQDTPMTLPYNQDTPMTLPYYQDTPMTLPYYQDGSTPPSEPETPMNGSPGISFPMTLPSFPDTPVASPYPPVYPNIPVARGCNIRILHADKNLGPVTVLLSGVTLVTSLNYGSISAYSQESSGTLLVTVVSADNIYQYIVQETMRFQNGDTYTVAIIPSAKGSSLYQISDVSCNKSLYNSCMRAINLSPDSVSLDISLLDGRTIAKNLSYMGIGSYKQFTPGTYRLLVYENRCKNNISSTSTGSGLVNIIPIIIGTSSSSCMTNLLKASQVQVASNQLYTVYLLGNVYDSEGLMILFVTSSFD